MENALTPTEQLLLRLARIRLTADDRQAVAELAARADWQEVSGLACRGGIGGLVAGHAVQLDIPTELKRTLTAVALRTEASNQRLLGIARQLCSAAEANGLTIIPLKGTALNLAGPYEDPGLRQQCDIDLLARPDQLDAVVTLFESLGCRPKGNREYSRRYQHHFAFFYGSEDARVLVELHWTAFYGPFHRLSHDLAALQSSQCVTVQGEPLRLLDPVDTVLSVALHLAVHRYREQLKWLVDIAELGRSLGSQLDADELWRRADSLGASRAVGYVLLLARELLQAPLPEPRGSRQLLQLLQLLSPASSIVASESQPGWRDCALIDLLNHDTPVGGARGLARKGRELLYRRQTTGVWNPKA